MLEFLGGIGVGFFFGAMAIWLIYRRKDRLLRKKLGKLAFLLDEETKIGR